MKSELYSPMKLDLSKKGLSEIMEQTYKDELEDSKYELAKLSNEEFLSQYLQLNQSKSIVNEYRHLLETPTCEAYAKFEFNEGQKKERIRKQIKESIQNGMKRMMNFFSKQQLKALATRKLTQSAEREKLSTSRKQKREVFYQTLRSSRKNQEAKEVKYQRQDQIKDLSISRFESPKKNATTEQTIDDLFIRIEVVGDNRDKIKKKWYGWGEKGKFQDKQAILQEWSSNHQLMKCLLETLLQRLSKQFGTIQVFNQLKIGNQTSVLESLSSRQSSQKQKSLVSTRIDKNLKPEQIKTIYRFSSWFNKLLLDQRQIEYIQNIKKQ